MPPSRTQSTRTLTRGPLDTARLQVPGIGPSFHESRERTLWTGFPTFSRLHLLPPAPRATCGTVTQSVKQGSSWCCTTEMNQSHMGMALSERHAGLRLTHTACIPMPGRRAGVCGFRGSQIRLKPYITERSSKPLVWNVKVVRYEK